MSVVRSDHRSHEVTSCYLWSNELKNGTYVHSFHCKNAALVKHTKAYVLSMHAVTLLGKYLLIIKGVLKKVYDI